LMMPSGYSYCCRGGILERRSWRNCWTGDHSFQPSEGVNTWPSFGSMLSPPLSRSSRDAAGLLPTFQASTELVISGLSRIEGNLPQPRDAGL
jgi:hypothetical protein